MNRGFFTILGAQFLSALADNALFFAALALLKEQQAPEWHLSMLLWAFTVSYVVIAPYAGAFADSMHKGRAMLICNGIKLAGCLGMLCGLPPIYAYAIVGFGAATYSPAKYGIITEYLPHEKLVEANGWLEGATVGAIILGTIIGGYLSGNKINIFLQSHTLGQYLSPAQFAIAATIVLYILAAYVNLFIPKLIVRLKPLHLDPVHQAKEFAWCVKRLWRDPQGQLSLGVTTLFWGAGATMRLVVLNWAVIWLALNLEQASQLIALVAIGIAIGAVIAGRYIPLQKAFSVMWAGIGMGALVIFMLWVNQIAIAALLMLIIGVLSGFFVVPLNAMLQHRGHKLMGAGHSIAVQNFNENLGILIMVGMHAWLVKNFSTPLASGSSALLQQQFSHHGIPPMQLIIVGFGGFVIIVMSWIIWRYHRNQGLGLLHD
ncbi:lysophospholipid transporter LplT [Chitinibacter bivalviorum]|uniref:Lysophospholipid transporter LplT n=1 Tax=Chitinibacter bivalviorum TaxID=2739434 RepID=A0A7H9BEZ7_9NEIS|nr:lysophospholipid transporter LplT [Chitinibacter bivalviorum]QLG86758.1 lysophospholipid transporter LplT [Chitinibacter bivalviorum]